MRVRRGIKWSKNNVGLRTQNPCFQRQRRHSCRRVGYLHPALLWPSLLSYDGLWTSFPRTQAPYNCSWTVYTVVPPWFLSPDVLVNLGLKIMRSSSGWSGQWSGPTGGRQRQNPYCTCGVGEAGSSSQLLFSFIYILLSNAVGYSIYTLTF
jgi:hypothetical protein